MQERFVNIKDVKLQLIKLAMGIVPDIRLIKRNARNVTSDEQSMQEVSASGVTN